MLKKLLKDFCQKNKKEILIFLIFHIAISIYLAYNYLAGHPIEKIVTWKDAVLYAISHIKYQLPYNLAPYGLWGTILLAIQIRQATIIRYLTYRNRIENIYMNLNVQKSKSRKRLITTINECFLFCDKFEYLGIAGWETLGNREHSEMWKVISENKNKEITFYLLNPDTASLDPIRRNLTILQARIADLNVGRFPLVKEREYKNWIRTTIEVIKELNQFREEKFKIRYCLYDERPFWRCYLFPKKVFFTYYQAEIHGHHSTMYQVSKRDDELNTIHYVFDQYLRYLYHKYPIQY